MFPYFLEIECASNAIKGVSLSSEKKHLFLGNPSPSLVRQVKGFFEAYPHGPLPPVDWSELSPFTRRVLEALLLIPCGEVKTYQEIARQIGCPKGARAVGSACSRNPFPFFIPCHRVVASKGLGGFLFGLDCKESLLNLERKLTSLK